MSYESRTSATAGHGNTGVPHPCAHACMTGCACGVQENAGSALLAARANACGNAARGTHARLLTPMNTCAHDAAGEGGTPGTPPGTRAYPVPHDPAPVPSRAAREVSPSSTRAAPVPHAADWLTADEATAYLRFPSRDALYQAVSRGQVPARRIGRRLRFRRAELDAHVRAA
jgi:excisionase family DNA binding protein